VKALPKEMGFGIGLELREKSNVLTLKNFNKVKAGMVFNVSVGRSSFPMPIFLFFDACVERLLSCSLSQVTYRLRTALLVAVAEVSGLHVQRLVTMCKAWKWLS
jgi:hypothetical protein